MLSIWKTIALLFYHEANFYIFDLHEIREIYLNPALSIKNQVPLDQYLVGTVLS